MKESIMSGRDMALGPKRSPMSCLAMLGALVLTLLILLVCLAIPASLINAVGFYSRDQSSDTNTILLRRKAQFAHPLDLHQVIKYRDGAHQDNRFQHLLGGNNVFMHILV